MHFLGILHGVVVTERDRQILDMLCCRVRMGSLRQLAHHWWSDTKHGTENARRRLATLVKTGLIQHDRVMAAPLPAVTQPVLRWEPGEGTPAFGSIAWQLQNRWQAAPRQTAVYFASVRATQLFGGRAPGRIKQEYQATHDLGVTEMFLCIRKTRPELAAQWIGEDVLAAHRRGQKLPDAVIASGPEERPALVLEFGGAYDKHRLIEFHADNEQRGLAYEVW